MKRDIMVYKEKEDEVSQFLFLCIKGDRNPSELRLIELLLSRLGVDVCRKHAKLNQVEALVGSSIKELLDDGEGGLSWLEYIKENQRRVLELTDALSDISLKLEEAGCNYVLIENSGVMFASGLSAEAFCAGDFDLLVDMASWPQAQIIFENNGFLIKDRRNRPTNRLEYFREIDNGAPQWLDAGTEAFDRMWAPLIYVDRSSNWIKSKVRSERASNIYVPEATDLLIQVAMHTSLHSFIRAPGVRLHVDVDRVVRDNKIDWAYFLSEVQLMGISTRCFVSLSMAAGLLETPIPFYALQALFPGRIRWSLIHKLLRNNGTLNDGKAKLPRFQSIFLDVLLCDEGIFRWLTNLLFPSSNWMREHFDRDNEGISLISLHLKRIKMVFKIWNPI
jgi:hypothetical protein